MQLLVSVRDPGEAVAAAAAGADIVDAKEPSNGALGSVAPATFEAIAASLPAGMPFSAALGEGGPDALLAAIHATPALPHRHGWFAKFALTVSTPAEALEAARACLAARCDTPRLILARYADHGLDNLDPWLHAAAAGGAWGVLLDTVNKDGRSLLDVAGIPVLRQAASRARELGLRLALAGGLGARHLEAVTATGAHVVGVRGSACDNGRDGQLSAARVATLRASLDQLSPRRATGALLASPP